MDSALGALPEDIKALKAALIAEKMRAAQAEAELVVAKPGRPLRTFSALPKPPHGCDIRAS
jgi:hypothetical protein